MRHLFSSYVLSFICFIVQLQILKVASLPLFTRSRWIIDDKGVRVKLACVNWPSHLETVLAEGLNKVPVDYICKNIVANGFNCVRFTWPVVLPTNESLASTTVEKHFESLSLVESIAGIRVNNPYFLDLTLIEAYQTVVSRLADNNIMVILDNHVSKATWCCSTDDGNGFFEDKYFDPQLWLKGLQTMAKMFSGNKHVVGMSLRNELRGPNQNASVWHRYMEQGAEVVHESNPNVLVILSGLSFDNDLGFLRTQMLNISFTNKLVFEYHQYGISFGDGWRKGNPNDVCGRFLSTFANNAEYLLIQGYPLFLSEFGGDQTGGNLKDNRFLECMYSVIANLDLDWALWALQGSYYWREGVKDMDEVYGVLNRDWNGIRNMTQMTRIKSVQAPFQGPGWFKNVAPYNLIYHPSDGLCIKKMSDNGVLRLSVCEEATAWVYNEPQKTIMIKEGNSCLQAVEVNMPVKLGNCSSSTANWEMITSSKLHLSTNITDGSRVCMEVESSANPVIIASSCKCLLGDPKCEASTQWFKIVTMGNT